MRKREAEELRRLEAALLENEYDEPDFDPEPELPEFYRDLQPEFDAYNTDDTDLDMDDYSEDVFDAPGRGNAISVLLTIATSLLLGSVVLLLLKYLGVF